VVISDQVGLRKPDPAIYTLAAAKIGVAPGSCVFVDDTAANLPAARDLGMAVVHFTEAEPGVAEIERLLMPARPWPHGGEMRSDGAVLALSMITQQYRLVTCGSFGAGFGLGILSR